MEVSAITTFNLAILVLFLGKFLNSQVSWDFFRINAHCDGQHDSSG